MIFHCCIQSLLVWSHQTTQESWRRVRGFGNNLPTVWRFLFSFFLGRSKSLVSWENLQASDLLEWTQLRKHVGSSENRVPHSIQWLIIIFPIIYSMVILSRTPYTPFSDTPTESYSVGEISPIALNIPILIIIFPLSLAGYPVVSKKNVWIPRPRHPWFVASCPSDLPRHWRAFFTEPI